MDSSWSLVQIQPAKPIRKRFDDAIIAKLLELKWWDWPKERIKANLEIIKSGRIDELK